jgi:FkbM family methyltransferase
MSPKDFFNPLFACAARVCEKSRGGRSALRNIDFRGKARIVSRIRPDRIGREITATCQGFRFQLDVGDERQRNMYFNCNDPLDLEELQCALNVIPVGGTCIDVGANIGIFTLPFAQRVGSRGSVYAFEPDPSNLKRLAANSALNGLEDIVRCRQAAVSNTSGQVSFYRSDSKHSGWGSVVEFKDIAVEHNTVPAITLDEFLLSEKMSTVDLLKVDVEAHEPELLEGARRSLAAKAFRVILIECNGVRLSQRGKTLGDLLDPILGAGYTPQFMRLDALRSLQSGRTPFNRVCTTFAFAVA